MPFPVGQSDQTPLHLAALGALPTILRLFIDHGGNPNSPNGREESSIHCLCRRSDSPRERCELLEMMLSWQGPEIDGVVEKVLVNHADVDG